MNASSKHAEKRFDTIEALTLALAQRCHQQLSTSLSLGRLASCVVPGGQTPGPILTQLARMPLEWDKVSVTASDERWVPESNEASNSRLIHTSLLKGAASKATYISLKSNHADAFAAQTTIDQRLSEITHPYNFTLLGMGNDGHTASLFPCCQQLDLALSMKETLRSRALMPTTAPHQRMTMTLPELLQSQLIIILITGQKKWDTYQRALSDLTESAQHQMPVRALLRQSQVPVAVYWSP